MERDAKTTRKKRRSGVQVDTSWHGRFLELFAQSLNVQLSCRGAGVDRGVAYDHRKRFPEFAAAWEDARRAAIENLEAEAFSRAKRQSDTLLIFLLKSHAPERYRDRIDLTTKGQPLTFATLAQLAVNEQPEGSESDPGSKPE